MKILTHLKQRGAVCLAVILAGTCITGLALAADPTAPLKLSDIANNLMVAISSTSRILSDIAIAAGIGFVLGSFFKMHQHRQNPQQITIGQPLTLLFIGALLLLFPALLHVFTGAVVGDQAKVTQLGGKELNDLIGGKDG